MKTIQTYLFTAIIISLTLVNCSKKQISSSIDEHNQKHSRQLEMPYDNNSTVLSTSTNENALIIPSTDPRFELTESKNEVAFIKKNKNLITKSLNAKGKDFKIISESHPFYKIVSKKIEKLKDEKKTSEIAAKSGRLRTGIIFASIGLIIFLVGYLLLWLLGIGVIPYIFIVTGAIFFIIGAILILVDLI